MCDVSVDNVSGTALVLDGVRNMGKLSGLNQYGHSEWGRRESRPFPFALIGKEPL